MVPFVSAELPLIALIFGLVARINIQKTGAEKFQAGYIMH